jgi:glycosyltransferase involved in cell wall biosynthesis
MSRFGFDRLSEASASLEAQGETGFPVRYAPHAVDDVFRPTETGPGFGRPFREMIGVPADAYLVGIVAANTGTAIYDRKGFGDMVAALAVFMSDHPDAWVYLHTLQLGHEGINLPVLLSVKGVDPARVRWADQYLLKKQAISDGDMAAIYSALDVLLATSRGEGFGLPVLEAQACGTPVIASNWTAQAELVGDAWSPQNMGAQRHPSGWLVDVDPDYDPRHAADFGKPRIASIIRALREAHERRGDPALRDAAIAKAETYRADAVFDTYWRPILAEMEAALHPAVVPMNREQRRAARKARAKVPA